jgi:hypothetical protein
MIKIHKLEDGDIIKILPMIDKNDNISWIKKYDCVGLNTKTFISDTKGYLRRISQKLRKSNSSLPISTRYAMNIYIDSEIRILNVGKKLFEMIIDNPKLWDIRGNHQIFVSIDEVSVGGGQLFHQLKSVYPSFDKSYVSEKSWTPPVNDINSQDEWFSYIKSNQPDFDNHLEKSNIFNHKQLLINHLGKDMLGELIADDRQKKLADLLE